MTAGSDALPQPGGVRGWRWRNVTGRARRGGARAPGAAVPGAGTRTLFGGGNREGDLVTVYTARTIEAAWIVRGRLVAHDVPAIVIDHTMSSVYGSALQRGVDVRVPRALADRAASILADSDS